MSETGNLESEKRKGLFDIPQELEDEITGQIKPVSINHEFSKLHDAMTTQRIRFVAAYQEYATSRTGVIARKYHDLGSQIATFEALLVTLGIPREEYLSAFSSVLEHLEKSLGES